MDKGIEFVLTQVASPWREERHQNWSIAVLTRLFQIAASALVLVVTSPIILLIAIMIRIDSSGPAIFRQTRIGKDKQPFTFYKFRTFFSNAREVYPELYTYRYTPEEIQTLHFKQAGDPRVTRVGRWLRQTSLDELPNFWNVLKGDMDFVGPRPEIPEMVQYYGSEQMIKFAVKPGITGLAQTNGRGRLSFQRTLCYDVEYVKMASIIAKAKIVLKTIEMIVTRDGAF